MQSPHTYAEWVAILDEFSNKTNDDVVIPAMKAGTLDWQAGVADRFMQKFIASVNKRMNEAVDRLGRASSKVNGHEGLLTKALFACRKEFLVLIDAVDIPAFPEEYRSECRELIKSQADEVQKSLENSALRLDSSGRWKSLFKRTPVNVF